MIDPERNESSFLSDDEFLSKKKKKERKNDDDLRFNQRTEYSIEHNDDQFCERLIEVSARNFEYEFFKLRIILFRWKNCFLFLRDKGDEIHKRPSCKTFTCKSSYNQSSLKGSVRRVISR